MDFGNDELFKPAMYRNITDVSNTPMGMSMGGLYGLSRAAALTDFSTMNTLGTGGMYQTNLLGGITMPNGLAEDTFQSYQRRQQKDYSFLKKTLIALGVITAAGLIKFKGLKNLFRSSGSGSSSSGGFFSRIKNFFRRTPATPPAPAPAPAAKKWWQFWK